jgi:hypothetical protein
MRGDYAGSPVTDTDTLITPSASSTAGASSGSTGSNVDDNMSLAKSPGSVWWLLLLGALYFVYYYLYNKSWKDAINTNALLAFLHNALSITILAVVGVNLMNVFLTKLAALKIPGISKAAGTFLPLFHL